MNWWNDLWLNEGFATYIAAKGVEKADADLQLLSQFQVATLHSILSLDATQGSHPIIQTVITPDQITEVFDSVSYNKGASILRMLEYVVTEGNFRMGVTNYLKAHMFGNAVTQDLLNEIQRVVGESLNVTEFMDTFTIQMGYPILEVTLQNNQYTLRQKRFLKDYNVDKQAESPLGYKWSIPVTYVTDLGESQIHWFHYKKDTLIIDKPDNIKWLKFNGNQMCYYRVNYPESEWENLINNIGEMSISDRTHLLEESFSIAESGDLNYKIPLDLTQYLINEQDYLPWSVASSQFQQISKYLQSSQKFKQYVISLLKPAYEALTWVDSKEDAHLTKLTRVVILNLACVLEYDEALKKASDLFNDWINSLTPISPDLRALIYKFGMVKADDNTWEKLFAIFSGETDANEKLKLMNGLANVRNPLLLRKLIDLAHDETYVRSQDYFTLLQYIAANPVGTPIVWDFVRENWKYLEKRFGLNDRYLGRLIPAITSSFTTNIKLDEMRQFFESNPDAGAGAAARVQALESVSNNVKWLEKYKVIVENWLNEITVR